MEEITLENFKERLQKLYPVLPLKEIRVDNKIQLWGYGTRIDGTIGECIVGEYTVIEG